MFSFVGVGFCGEKLVCDGQFVCIEVEVVEFVFDGCLLNFMRFELSFKGVQSNLEGTYR